MERKTVLLVDDNPSNLKLLVDCLESHDFRVAVATNGDEALKRLQRAHLAKPDLILLDIMMPGIDGYETCRQIKLIPEISDIPIIFLSALSETPDKVYGFSLGAVDYITKPINLAEMIARVNTHLDLSELRRKLDRLVQKRTQELLDVNASLRHQIEERERAEAQIRYIATHDSLTDLPNRFLMAERLDQLIKRAHRYNERIALMFLDLDQFKIVNESLGHRFGDMLLSDVAYRLKDAALTADAVARLGGDDFVICLPLHDENEDVIATAKTMLEALREPFYINDINIHVSASIGVAVYPDDGKDADRLMRNADAALYCAKQAGRAEIKRYTTELDTAAHEHLNLSSLLTDAIREGELCMEYQPQIELNTGKIIGAEALMRWRRADGTYISPAEFIPVAESSGQIKVLGEWGIRQSCAELKRWHDAGYTDLSMSVNVSVPQLHSAGFVDTVQSIIEEYQLPPAKLELEITESLLMQHSKTNLNILHTLSDFGVLLSVDDFGTGYSSLAYLQDFPVNTLKIDISFVRNIGTDSGDAIPSAIVAMAHSLGLNVVAEGVETGAQEAFLRSQGCEYAQGFHYSRSVPGDRFLELCKAGISTADNR
ncbi:EAL domain-containing protein [Marinobacterium sp. D7]|uniref:EAL domain-containing response regulator n=1 Tax=Marinobacterium ramblicola TaxID=2849041 RepID=UPI001C2CFC6D|nr:GGDEF domain-containing response regulator [Marinobacterium ramblicola]MBV1787363.1 EAL domain-containing protein [Marinobacterium ramblicola]